MKHLHTFGVVVAMTVALGGVDLAQAQATAEAQEREAQKKVEAQLVETLKKKEAAAKEAQQRDAERFRLIPLSVDVVVSRYQADKKISSLPYSLAVNANDSAPGGVCQLRMGASVPVPSLVAPPGTTLGPAGPMPGPVTYRDIGTNIDCSARSLEEGGFQLRLTVEDTSVYTNVQDSTTPTVGQMPVFRSFRSTNTLVLRDGQTRDFTAAADRVSGEVVRIAVTLKVVK